MIIIASWTMHIHIQLLDGNRLKKECQLDDTIEQLIALLKVNIFNIKFCILKIYKLKLAI